MLAPEGVTLRMFLCFSEAVVHVHVTDLSSDFSSTVTRISLLPRLPQYSPFKACPLFFYIVLRRNLSPKGSRSPIAFVLERDLEPVGGGGGLTLELGS